MARLQGRCDYIVDVRLDEPNDVHDDPEVIGGRLVYCTFMNLGLFRTYKALEEPLASIGDISP